jgi:superfamily I DNA/RNA helicase
LNTEKLQTAGLDANFLAEEIAWIKEHEVTDWETYSSIKRQGRVIQLLKPQRQVVWGIFEKYKTKLNEIKLMDWEDVPLQVLQLLDSTPLPEKYYYNMILIDEGQDFAPTWFKVVSKLQRIKNAHILIAADIAQKIYQRSFTWEAVGFDIRGKGKSQRLAYSYRTTPEILNLAYRLIHDDPIIGDEIQEIEGHPYQSPLAVLHKHGPIPILCAYPDGETEVQRIADEIIKLHSIGNLAWKDFLVLTRTRNSIQNLKNLLAKNDLPVETTLDELDSPHVNSQNRIQQKIVIKDKVRVTTFHSAKGIEAKVVFICGLDKVKDGEAAYYRAKEKQLLYVGMTRAQERLYMSYSGEIPNWILDNLLDSPSPEKPVIQFKDFNPKQPIY